MFDIKDLGMQGKLIKMDRDVLISSFINVKKWQRKGERAPHKPLTLLYALGQFQRSRYMLPFISAKTKIEDLLVNFGPNRKTQANYPFSRLSNDGIWTFNKPSIVNTKTNLSTKYLVDNNIAGGFNSVIQSLLIENPSWIPDIVQSILDDNFPPTLHEDIINSCGINMEDQPKYQLVKRKPRDPVFRERVLQAYSYQCAMCKYQLRLGHQLIGVEAAHIKWHTAGGPDEESNGLALCSLHHKMLDSGVFSLDENLKVRVSLKANGPSVEQYLLPYEQKVIYIPRKKENYPNPEFVEWHVNEVFKGGYR